MDILIHLGFSHATPVVVVIAAIATFAAGLWAGLRRRASDHAPTPTDEHTDQ